MNGLAQLRNVNTVHPVEMIDKTVGVLLQMSVVMGKDEAQKVLFLLSLSFDHVSPVMTVKEELKTVAMKNELASENASVNVQCTAPNRTKQGLASRVIFRTSTL